MLLHTICRIWSSKPAAHNITKKKTPGSLRIRVFLCSLFNSVELSFSWSVNWASASASAAVDASVSIYYVDVTFADSVNWTFVDASATSDASVSNLESHSKFLLVQKIYL